MARRVFSLRGRPVFRPVVSDLRLGSGFKNFSPKKVNPRARIDYPIRLGTIETKIIFS